MSLSRFKLWVFDLDGTLIDSRLDLANAINATLEAYGLPRLSEERIVTFIGDGADDLIRLSFTAAGWSAEEAHARLPEILKDFLDFYAENCLDRTTVYPGARELLADLSARGLALAVLTNKPERLTEAVLAGFGLRDHFAVVVPGDSPLGKKPDPTGLAYILKTMNVSPGDAVMVGDSIQDLRAARGANTAFLAYMGGLGDADAVRASEPDFMATSYVELATRLGAKT